jgi:hypothetical protein
MKKHVKAIQKIKEDLEQRRQQLRQRQIDQMKSHKDKVASHQAAQRERQSATQEREQLKKEIKRELQSEQHPTMKPNEYNKQIARQSARWKGMQIRQAHGEMEHEAGAEVAAKKARLKAIMSRESVESVDENVSSGSARRARFGVKQRVSSAEVITNTERQNQVAKHFADHAARKKASGDEAHAAATKAGKSPIEAETARQRAHRQYERQLKKGS